MIFVLQGAKSKYNRWLNAEVEERKEKGEKKRVVSLQPAWTTSAKAVHVWTECTEWILSKPNHAYQCHLIACGITWA